MIACCGSYLALISRSRLYAPADRTALAGPADSRRL
jgi:hypothetical protein